MNITVTADKPVDEKLTVKVTVPAAEVDAAIKQAYKDIANKYSFQGFRKGRAPRPVIDGIVGREAVLAQATNDLLGAAEPQLLEELDLVPVGRGDYNQDADLPVEGQDYSYEVVFNVRPEAKLDSYDAPAINMPPNEATEAEVDHQIKQLLSYQAKFENTKEKRAVKEGDTIGVDIKNIEGAAHMEGEDRVLTLNGTQAPKELEEALIGMKPGEEKEVKWTHSHTHGDEVHSHDYDINVKVVAHKKNSLPTLKEDRVVEAVGKRLQLEEVPEEYKNEVFNEIAQEFLNGLQQQGMSLDMFLAARGIKTDDFISDLRVQAEERARQSLALDAVAAELKLEATEEDIRAEFERAGVPNVESAIEEWRKAGRLPAIRESIRRSKALDWLRDNATVTVVDEIAEAAKEEQKAEKKPAKKAPAKKKAAKKDEDAEKDAE